MVELSKKSSRPVAKLGDVLARYTLEDKGGYISQEFQDYGYRLALELDDLKHKSLYIRLAQKESRGLLERARSFVADANAARSKPRLFMWKIKQLKADKKPTDSIRTTANTTTVNLAVPKQKKATKRNAQSIEKTIKKQRKQSKIQPMQQVDLFSTIN